MSNSLTDKDFQKIADVIKKLLDAKFDHIEKKLDMMSVTYDDYTNGLKRIENKLDKFLSILNRFSKKQRILEEKMRLIEDYFDPHPRN
jgi:thiamine kinase-like enzyme